MKANDVFPSKYLKASDLQGHEPTVTIDRVVMEQLSDGESKPVMYFQGKKKGLIVNRTNWMAIAFLYGDESNDWPGRAVTLFSAMVTTPSGKPIEGLRIKLPPQRNGGPTQNPQNPMAGFVNQKLPPIIPPERPHPRVGGEGGDLNDDIPDFDYRSEEFR
jgi:hypothetical protein